MWLAKYLTCLFKGHDCSELTSEGKDFTYCHRCGRVKLVRSREGRALQAVEVVTHRPTVATMPIDKMWR